MAYRYLGEYERATDDFDEVLRLDSQSVEAYVNRGDVYSLQGEFDQAIADYDEAIGLNPLTAEIYLKRGMTHVFAGQQEQAIADFKQILSMSSDPGMRLPAEVQLRQLGVEP